MDDLGNLESIAESVDLSTNNEIPMGAPPEAAPEIPQTPQEYEFESEGRKYKGDIEKLKRWAQQGVSAPNRIGQMAKELDSFKAKSQQFEQYEKTYKPIDEWAKQNPDKWQSLFQSWQQAQYGAQAPQPGQAQAFQQLPPEVIQKLQAHEQKFSQLEQKEQVQRERAADQGLDGEIESIRKQFSNVDFNAPDASGNSLEYQILEHATKNGIPSFRAAFRDYCFDQIKSISESNGRGAAAIPSKTKAGLLGKNPTPSRTGLNPDLKNRNYDQIHEFILTEMGLSG